MAHAREVTRSGACDFAPHYHIFMFFFPCSRACQHLQLEVPYGIANGFGALHYE